MFMSLTNSFSIQTLHEITGHKMPWLPIRDESVLLKYLKGIGKDTHFRIAGVDYLSRAIMVTHKYCERMLWGRECFGRGLKTS